MNFSKKLFILIILIFTLTSFTAKANNETLTGFYFNFNVSKSFTTANSNIPDSTDDLQRYLDKINSTYNTNYTLQDVINTINDELDSNYTISDYTNSVTKIEDEINSEFNNKYNQINYKLDIIIGYNILRYLGIEAGVKNFGADIYLNSVFNIIGRLPIKNKHIPYIKIGLTHSFVYGFVTRGINSNTDTQEQANFYNSLLSPSNNLNLEVGYEYALSKGVLLGINYSYEKRDFFDLNKALNISGTNYLLKTNNNIIRLTYKYNF